MKINRELIFINGDFISIFSLSALKSKCIRTIKTNTYCKNLFERIAIRTLSISIPITLPKTKNLCGNLASVSDGKFAGVIYNNGGKANE